MLALTVAVILLTLITAVMYALEGLGRMQKNARATRRAERRAERMAAQEQHYQRHYESIQADAVEDLRLELDLYDAAGFLWLDGQSRRKEDHE